MLEVISKKNMFIYEYIVFNCYFMIYFVDELTKNLNII